MSVYVQFIIVPLQFMNEIEPLTSGQQRCPSDMLAALENLEQMFHAYRYCLNGYAANAVLMGMAIEAQTLALKMKAMLGRWNKYLPFHEVMDVNFDYWQKLVSEWIEVLGMNPSEEVDDNYPWLMGCKEYMLDLYAQTECIDENGQRVVRAPEFYEVGIKDDYQREMTAYMERMDGLLHEMAEYEVYDDDWREEVARMAADSLRDAFIADLTMPYSPDRNKEVVEKLAQDIKERFETLVGFDDTQECALIALRFLQNQLCDLQALFCKALPNEMFIRLSTRLFYRHCLCSYREGETHVNRWRNSWPEAHLKKNAVKKKEELKKQLVSKSYGMELQEYITIDSPNLFGDSNFGKFLFTNRYELKVEDVKYIHKVCRELNLLNKLIAEEGAEVHTHSAPIRQLDVQEQEILRKVVILAKKASWENISEPQAITALHKALGMGPVFADTKLVGMSQKLWDLLKKRRGCDADKSLMVTWLNIVGHCVKKGLMSGGSPALAKKFFPQCGSDDYKAIDKGRSGENKNFQSIVPLLDACFRV